MRTFFTWVHRYLGLSTAVFLIITGLTGAVISWDHELDEWLNPHLIKTNSTGQTLNAWALAEKIEQEHPEVQVTYFETAIEPGHTLYYWVQPRVNTETGKLYKPGFNQVYVDPISGEIQGKREWGSIWPINRENFVSFLYKLHFSLHIPEFWGIDHWGIWLLGIIALIWTVDCFVGFYLTLPNKTKARKAIDDIADDTANTNARSYWQRWLPAWKIRYQAGFNKLNFDLHRAVGLWVWLLLFIIAFTAFSLNLYREVFFPAMSMVSDVTPTPIDERTPSGPLNTITPAFGFAKAISLAEEEAKQKGWQKPVGSLWHAREYGIYRVEFFAPEAGHGSGGVGHDAIYLDSISGEILGDWRPWQGTAADLFVQAQFPLHSGRILGLPGRILISIMGVVIAMLSITGIIIWWKKYRARKLMQARKPKPSKPELADENLVTQNG